MIAVLIIGNGNVANHLYNAFKNVKQIKVSKINSRVLDNVPLADITILAVSDDAIKEVSSKIKNPFVVHTSGSVGINDLKSTSRKGVFYMLQTFTKEKKVDFKNIPFCLEATHKADEVILEKIASYLGKNIYHINTAQRKKLHVAAVFVNNFSNHMYTIGQDICLENKIPFKILSPLIYETALKAETLSPRQAQTGPAIRNDLTTINNHLESLNEEHKNIYKLITKSIQNGAKL
jgi:predicted short-subunit dehydrogenase-like oxidoreductase (DUF2520 family)